MNERESLGVGQKCASSSSELGVERKDLEQYFDLECAHLYIFIPMIPAWFQKPMISRASPVSFKD